MLLSLAHSALIHGKLIETALHHGLHRSFSEPEAYQKARQHQQRCLVLNAVPLHLPAKLPKPTLKTAYIGLLSE